MQHLLVLPGNSVENRTWGEVILNHYGPRFGSARMISYEHWEIGAPLIDFDVELVKLRELQTAPLFDADELVVMAKSAGSLLAMVATDEGVIKPSQAIFFGIPFDLAARDIFKDDWSAVDNFSVPTVAFHNQHDPTADYRFTTAILAEHAPHIKLVTTTEDNHWYGAIDTYDPHITQFLGSEAK